MLSAPGHGRTDSATHGGMSDLDALNKNILLVRGSCVSALQRLRCICRQGTAVSLTFVSWRLVVACVWISRLAKSWPIDGVSERRSERYLQAYHSFPCAAAVAHVCLRLIDRDSSGHVQSDLLGLLDRKQQARGRESGGAQFTEACAGMGKRDPEKPAGLPLCLPILLSRVRKRGRG